MWLHFLWVECCLLIHAACQKHVCHKEQKWENQDVSKGSRGPHDYSFPQIYESCNICVLVSFDKLDRDWNLGREKLNWVITSTRLASRNVYGALFFKLLIWEGSDLSGCCHLWTGGPGLYKDGSWASHFCYHSCLQTPDLSSCLNFPQQWTVIHEMNLHSSSDFGQCYVIRKHQIKTIFFLDLSNFVYSWTIC